MGLKEEHMRRYRLMRGDDLLGLVGVDGYRFHAVPAEGEGAFTPMPAFVSVQPLLERLLELWPEAADEYMPEWWALVDELIQPGLYLESKDGERRVDIMWMFVKDERAWWSAVPKMSFAEALRRALRRRRRLRQRRRKRRPPPEPEG